MRRHQLAAEPGNTRLIRYLVLRVAAWGWSNNAKPRVRRHNAASTVVTSEAHTPYAVCVRSGFFGWAQWLVRPMKRLARAWASWEAAAVLARGSAVAIVAARCCCARLFQHLGLQWERENPWGCRHTAPSRRQLMPQAVKVWPLPLSGRCCRFPPARCR